MWLWGRWGHLEWTNLHCGRAPLEKNHRTGYVEKGYDWTEEPNQRAFETDRLALLLWGVGRHLPLVVRKGFRSCRKLFT